MVGVNKVILIGNLGKDPEIITFDTAKKAIFPLATTEFYRNKDGDNIFAIILKRYLYLNDKDQEEINYLYI